jgi:ketosteroid isomerase-like protein
MRLVLVMPLLLLVASLLARSIDDRASDRAYIHQAESDWAESVATNDVGILERILADDFVGVDIDGSHYYKAGAMKDYRSGPSSFLSDHLNEVEIRFYGNTAVAQGSESWKKKDGTVGRFVWTDTWIKRNGKWQVVAAEDLVPPASASAK